MKKLVISIVLLCGTLLIASSVSAESRWSRKSREHKEACQNWCDSNNRCSHCSTLYNCGAQYTGVKHWTGYGKNYHACQKSGSVNYTWPGSKGITSATRYIVVSVGGSGASSGDDGIEWFCEDYLSGSNARPKIHCISSYALVTTASSTLASNISNLANDVYYKSGVKPKIIYVGKSMGGCKGHHAADNLQAYGWDIDMFIGVDMSCYVARHWEKGMSDALEFPYNVNNLLVFYQNKSGEMQSGHAGVYLNDNSIDYNRHVNVNTERYSVSGDQKSSSYSHCNNTGHMDIDDCSGLKNTIRRIIYKRAGYSY